MVDLWNASSHFGVGFHWFSVYLYAMKGFLGLSNIKSSQVKVGVRLVTSSQVKEFVIFSIAFCHIFEQGVGRARNFVSRSSQLRIWCIYIYIYEAPLLLNYFFSKIVHTAKD
jgi:hypothetical protein